MGIVRVKSVAPEQQGPYVIIEESDFDPKIHTKYNGPTDGENAPADPPAESEPLEAGPGERSESYTPRRKR